MKAACTVPDYAYAKYSEREPDPFSLFSTFSFTSLVRGLYQNKVNFSLLDLQVSIKHKDTFYGTLEEFSNTINISC